MRIHALISGRAISTPAPLFALAIFGSCLLFLGGCGSVDEAPQGAPQRPDREPFTTSYKVKMGDEVVGYATRFDEVPVGQASGERRYPTGTYTVEDANFESAGWVTPKGQAFQLFISDSGRVFSRSLGNDDSLENSIAQILRIEDGGQRLEVRPIGNY